VVEVSTALRRRGERTEEGWILLRDGEGHDDLVGAVSAPVVGAPTLHSSAVEAFDHHPARETLLRGLTLPADATVLEVGAGTGALSRHLGERVARVDALEPVLARARVARARTSDLPGVEVFVGDYSDVPEEPCYDVVIALDVLEGAGVGEVEPDVQRLRRLGACLVPGGTLIVAVENLVGVKRLVHGSDDAGPAREAVDGGPAQAPRTLPRRELEEMFVAAGLRPTIRTAFVDNGLTHAVMDVDGLSATAPRLVRELPFPADLPGRGRRSADARAAWCRLVGAGLGAEVGDSFLVLAGKGDGQQVWPPDLLAAYTSFDRNESCAFDGRVLRAQGGAVIARRRVAPGDGAFTVTDGEERVVDGPSVQELVEERPDDAMELLARWRDLVAERTARAGEEVPVDLLPSDVLVLPDGSMVPVGQGRTARGWTLNRLVRRGVLRLAVQAVRHTSPSGWPEDIDGRSLAVRLGAVVGLDSPGHWVDLALREEARTLAETTPPVAGESREAAVSRWTAELVAMLDTPLDGGSGLPQEPLRQGGPEDHRAAVKPALRADAQSEAEVHRLSVELAAVAAELAQIRGSRAWRVVRRFYGLVEHLAPHGTARRRAYARAVRTAVRCVRLVVRPWPSGTPRATPREAAAAVVDATLLDLGTSEEPVVSVVIPVYGKWEFTAQCLRSFMEVPPTVPHEVLVVDDASPDDTLERLREVVGIRVVALSKNRGFVGATNAGIEAARGEYVVMLNNDTQITAGWLEALVGTASQPGVGLVGSKLVYPDGRLQEAGGIIFANGGGWNYGRLDDPGRERYAFARDVDYCSGASIIVRRDLLESLGYLDTRFAPAYYEDVDLAFSVREKGLRVVYEPNSVVIHHEGVSHGTDTSSGIKAYQEINRAKLVDKWAHRLTEHYPQEEALVQAAARRQDGKGTIVVIDDHVPRPDEDAGSVRMFGMLQSLRRLGWSVIFIPDNGYDGDVWGRRLLAEGVEIFRGPEPVDQFLFSIRGRVKAVIGSRVTVAWPYIGVVRRVLPGVPFIFDTVDLHHLRERREAELSGDVTAMMRAEQTRGLELGFVQAADVTLVVSPTEVEVLAQEVPDAKAAVVPLVHERHLEVPGAEGRQGIVFVGSFAHPPNADAVRWFLSDVFPLVRAEVPDARLQIVGRGVPDDLLAEAGEGVDILGWLPSLDVIYARSRVAIAPLRYGAGLKGKVAEALSHGVPVVMTRIAAEGLGIEHGESGWVADDPLGFAAGVIALVRDDEMWSRMSIAGRKHIDDTLGVARFERLLAEALATVGLGCDG